MSSKKPLTHGEWERVDGHLIARLASQDSDDPTIVRIANSGYDTTPKWGFIACRDLASENWVTSAIRSLGGPKPCRGWPSGPGPRVNNLRSGSVGSFSLLVLTDWRNASSFL